MKVPALDLLHLQILHLQTLHLQINTVLNFHPSVGFTLLLTARRGSVPLVLLTDGELKPLERIPITLLTPKP